MTESFGESFGLILSYPAAAAKLAAALWLTQMAIVLLRSRSVPAWQICLAIGTFAASAVAWRAQADTGWMIACALALLMLIDGLRLWMSETTAAERTPTGKSQTQRWPWFGLSLSLLGSAVCTYSLVQSNAAAKINGQPHVMMIFSLVLLSIVFAMLLACTLELTIGTLGAELLALPWPRLSTTATFVFLLEILLAGWVIAKLRPHETIEMTAAPVLYEFSRLLLGYIAWCVPRRMVILSQRKELKGQASLALSGWIALICFALAMALPTAWPWRSLV